MAADFDTPIPIKGHGNSKWDKMPALGVTAEDAIPMWVADMDFAAAAPIREALRAEIERGYLGYPASQPEVKAEICNWLQTRHGWQVEPDWIRFSHGVIAGFAACLHGLTDPGDGVILFSPVYHVFFKKTVAMGRRVVESPLVERDGQYHMDLDALESQLDGNEKILVLCSPHNPGGRLWSKAEINAVAGFCDRHDLLLVSDEIHMDLTFGDARHQPTATAAPQVLPRLVTLTAASKSFNIAGGETGYAVIPDTGLRAAYDTADGYLGGTPNRFGLAMTRAAYGEGADWMDAVRAYLGDNFRLWAQSIGALPGITVMPMQATYLSWVDFTDTGLTQAEIVERLGQTARLCASPGPDFGTGGEHHMRFNIAMPRARLEEAIARFRDAFADLQ